MISDSVFITGLHIRNTVDVGVLPAKDHLTVKQFLEAENQSEEKLEKVREPALKIANKLLD